MCEVEIVIIASDGSWSQKTTTKIMQLVRKIRSAHIGLFFALQAIWLCCLNYFKKIAVFIDVVLQLITI